MKLPSNNAKNEIFLLSFNIFGALENILFPKILYCGIKLIFVNAKPAIKKITIMFSFNFQYTINHICHIHCLTASSNNKIKKTIYL